MYIHMHIYVHIHIYIYMYAHIYVHIQIYTHIYAYALIYIYLHNSCMRAYATVQHLLCHGNYCELILSLARTSCSLSFSPAILPLRRAGRTPAGSLPDTVRLRNPSKSTLAHDVVAAVVLQSIIRSSALVRSPPVCLWSTLAHGRRPHPRQKSIFMATFTAPRLHNAPSHCETAP